MNGVWDEDAGIVTYFDAADGDRLRRAWIDRVLLPWARENVRRWPDDGYAVILEQGGGLPPDKVELGVRGTRVWSRHGEWADEELVPLFALFLPDLDTWNGAEVSAGRLVIRDGGPAFEITAPPLRPWLDGIRTVGYEGVRTYPAGEGDARRRAYVDEHVVPRVAARFAAHPQLRSAALATAQYWNDSALDEVHGKLLWSELPTPDLHDEDSWYVSAWRGHEHGDPVNQPSGGLVEYEHVLGGLGDDDVALWACTCSEGGDQNDEDVDVYTPVAYLRRVDDGVEVEMLGPVARPWLDGIRPTLERPGS